VSSSTELVNKGGLSIFIGGRQGWRLQSAVSTE
jgi:hypothetical protein